MIAASRLRVWLAADAWNAQAADEAPHAVSVSGDGSITRALARLVRCIIAGQPTLAAQWRLLSLVGRQEARFKRIRRQPGQHGVGSYGMEDASELLQVLLYTVCHDMGVPTHQHIESVPTETVTASCEVEWMQMFETTPAASHDLLVR